MRSEFARDETILSAFRERVVRIFCRWSTRTFGSLVAPLRGPKACWRGSGDFCGVASAGHFLVNDDAEDRDQHADRSEAGQHFFAEARLLLFVAPRGDGVFAFGFLRLVRGFYILGFVLVLLFRFRSRCFVFVLFVVFFFVFVCHSFAAVRSLALRDRGFMRTSAGVGAVGFFASTFHRLSSRNAFLTSLSSNE